MIAVTFAAAIALDGCWTAPVATIQPNGEPRLIQAAVAVESVKGPVVVQSVDAVTRTVIVADTEGVATSVYRAGPRVSNFDRIRPGDRIEATVSQELTVFVLRNGWSADADGNIAVVKADAKVLAVDPSYRLLTLQYPDGRTETVKVGLGARLQQMEAGDGVVIRDVEAVALRVRAH